MMTVEFSAPVSSIFPNYREAVQVQLLWPQLQAAEHTGGAPGPLPQLLTEPGITAGGRRSKPRYSATAVEEQALRN